MKYWPAVRVLTLFYLIFIDVVYLQPIFMNSEQTEQRSVYNSWSWVRAASDLTPAHKHRQTLDELTSVCQRAEWKAWAPHSVQIPAPLRSEQFYPPMSPCGPEQVNKQQSSALGSCVSIWAALNSPALNIKSMPVSQMFCNDDTQHPSVLIYTTERLQTTRTLCLIFYTNLTKI